MSRNIRVTGVVPGMVPAAPKRNAVVAAVYVLLLVVLFF